MKEVSSELEADALVAEYEVARAQDAASAAAGRANGTAGHGEGRNSDAEDRKVSVASDNIDANVAEMMRPNYFSLSF